MGTSSSTVKAASKTMSDEEWELDVMGFEARDLKKLRKCFDSASTSKDNGEADIKRMMISFGLESNKFITHTFSTVMSPQSGVTFRNVAVIFFYFCTIGDDVPLGIFGHIQCCAISFVICSILCVRYIRFRPQWPS